MQRPAPADGRYVIDAWHHSLVDALSKTSGYETSMLERCEPAPWSCGSCGWVNETNRIKCPNCKSGRYAKARDVSVLLPGASGVEPEPKDKTEEAEEDRAEEPTVVENSDDRVSEM